MPSEFETLYNPTIIDLERNHREDNDREIVYLEDVIAAHESALTQARRQGAYEALIEHEGVYDDDITKGEVYKALVAQITPYERELKTKQGDAGDRA